MESMQEAASVLPTACLALAVGVLIFVIRFVSMSIVCTRVLLALPVKTKSSPRHGS
jgi:hypothetical protein